MIIKKRLLAIANKIYTVIPETGSYKVYDAEDWSTTTAAAITPTNNIYLTTSYGNLWEISLNDDGARRRVDKGGWDACNVLISIKSPETLGNKLFSFCDKLWLVDQKVGSCIDFSDGSSDDDWSEVNVATSINDKIYFTTSNNLWCIDTSKNYKPEKIGNDDDWSNCKALVNVNGMLLAFCHWLWEVDVETGECKLFFNKEGEKLDTVKRAVRVVSNEDWSGTNALIAINI
ncbi:9437_t:CDS:2 [Entrophospora sp. SA101]|nr:2800_t:CDS:2 [Entrophospora sp. SA101]CAJ0825556.1 9437_t:CDS:2 [Entrophospora sp. SA101]